MDLDFPDVRRIEEQIEGGSADQGRMRFDVNQLRAKVADLEDRLGQIEAILAAK